MNSIIRRVTRNYCWRTLAILLVAASSLLAYPTAGVLTLTGAGDSLGQYNFIINSNPQTGSGGGHVGSVTNVQPPITQLFCDDFLNSLNTLGPVNVNVSSLGDAIAANGGGNTLVDTRFGAITSWNSVKAIDPGLNNSKASTLDNLNALQRYEVVAYLMTQYSFFTSLPVSNVFHNISTVDPADGGIQAAIWAVLSPSAVSNIFLQPPTSGSALATSLDTWLTKAADWWTNPGSDRSFLANFMIVTDSKVAGAVGTAKLETGIQELMYVVPEPSFYALLAVGLGLLVWRRRRLA